MEAICLLSPFPRRRYYPEADGIPGFRSRCKLEAKATTNERKRSRWKLDRGTLTISAYIPFSLLPRARTCPEPLTPHMLPKQQHH
jgi:hypothetical protein